MRRPFPTTGELGVKICGFRGLTPAVEAAALAGAAAIGINFWPKSKRYHPLAQAMTWLDRVPLSLNRVAVLVNASEEEIRSLWGSGMIDTLQFHGDEPDDLVRRYVEQGIPCIRAMAVRTEADLEKAAACPTANVLLDAYAPGVYGGTGEACDWELARRAVIELPEKKIILSGGLTVGNIATATQQVHPAGVDVASGVETAPAEKDPILVREFILAALCGATQA